MKSIKSRTTIGDLAAFLGVTKSTVSRALNDYPDISETTRLRVRKAASAMSYRPLSHAQAIKTGRVRSIGLVLQVSEHDGHRPFLADFLAGITQAASEQDWTLTIATAANVDDAVRLLNKLSEERKADGFILPRTYVNDLRIKALREQLIPFVLYGRTADIAECSWFDIAGEDAMVDAVERLYNLGHRRIAFLPGGEGYNYSVLRHEGYKVGLEKVGIEYDDRLVGNNAVNQEQGRRAADLLLHSRVPPTAIICSVDLAALGAYEAIEHAGLAVGKDISIISYDGIPEGAIVTPSLSTFAVNTRHAGERLTDLLIRRIRGEAAQELRELAQADFLDRQSHGPRTRTSKELAQLLETKSNYREENDE